MNCFCHTYEKFDYFFEKLKALSFVMSSIKFQEFHYFDSKDVSTLTLTLFLFYNSRKCLFLRSILVVERFYEKCVLIRLGYFFCLKVFSNTQTLHIFLKRRKPIFKTFPKSRNYLSRISLDIHPTLILTLLI